jgi:hypothetical protein
MLDTKRSKRKCRITEISRRGTKAALHTRQKIQIGTRLKVEIKGPATGSPTVKCIVTVLWIDELRTKGPYRFACGGRFDVIRNDDRWRLLDMAFEEWKQREDRRIEAARPRPKKRPPGHTYH